MANETLALILRIHGVRECGSGRAAKARQGTKPVAGMTCLRTGDVRPRLRQAQCGRHERVE
jgi:hypothetical protein